MGKVTYLYSGITYLYIEVTYPYPQVTHLYSEVTHLYIRIAQVQVAEAPRWDSEGEVRAASSHDLGFHRGHEITRYRGRVCHNTV